MSEVVDRFFRYVQIDTQADRNSTTYPSSAKQLDLARVLAAELKEIGLEDVELDKWGYVTATIPATTEKSVPVIGFLAHMDTSPDASGTGVKPRLVKDYDGKDILLNEKQNIILSPRDFPSLARFAGQDLVVTDGTTLLGADDKAGVAAIVTAANYLMKHPEIKHGKIRLAFTPDEEVGAGVDHFDVKKFGAAYAYTVDGGETGELEYETFNAVGAKITINGRSVHPGAAKGLMKNASSIAMEFDALLPKFNRPEFTEGYEGFFHLVGMTGEVEQAVLEYILRDHSDQEMAKMKNIVQDAADFLNKRYGANTVIVELKDQYLNMRKMIEPHPHILQIAHDAFLALGIEPKTAPIRGGTDGSRLSYMGLPTPNLFTGGMNYHGRFEYVSVQGMEKAVQVIAKIAELTAEHFAK